MTKDNNVQKGGEVPSGDSPNITPEGVGFTNQGTQKGVPKESTANEKQTIGSKGELPGKVETTGFSGGSAGMHRLPGSLHKAAIAISKMTPDERTMTAGLVKQYELGLLKAEEFEAIEKSENSVATEVRKAIEAAVAPLQKAISDLQAKPAVEKAAPLQKGLVPVGEAVEKPGLEKSDMVPTYDNSRAGLEKSITEGASGRLYDRVGGQMVPKGTPKSFADFAALRSE